MKKQQWIEMIFFGVLCATMFYFMINSGDNLLEEENSTFKYEVMATVTEVDNDSVTQAGASAIGLQYVTVVIDEGKYKGQTILCDNQLMGQLEFDQFYSEGDRLLVGLLIEDGVVLRGRTIELHRSHVIQWLFIVFVILLLLYARDIGMKALFSFMASLLILWRFLIPQLLNGKNPLLIVSLTLVMLSAIILFTVAGITRKGISAFLGTMMGLMITIGITIFVGQYIGLAGMTAPYAQTIYFSGFLDLNMLQIFYAAILIGSSGAAMDIAMDVSSAVNEIKAKRPDIHRLDLIASGLTVGRDVIGTMTTTLLLAYSGSYLTLLMLFQIKGSSLIRMMNMKIVTAEIMRTLIGSIGLVLVAPITAIIAGTIIAQPNKEEDNLIDND